MTFQIRKESGADQQAIHRVTEVAFREMPFADGDEQDVVDRLRSSGALSLSLVASIEGEIVGQVSFSPAEAARSSELWFALGPVSVLPEHQGFGIGSALISQGLKDIEAQGAAGCILTGNPRFYQRFGFKLAPKNAPENEPEEYFMIKSFQQTQPEGTLLFHEAFYGDAER